MRLQISVVSQRDSSNSVECWNAVKLYDADLCIIVIDKIISIMALRVGCVSIKALEADLFKQNVKRAEQTKGLKQHCITVATAAYHL